VRYDAFLSRSAFKVLKEVNVLYCGSMMSILTDIFTIQSFLFTGVLISP